MNQADFERTAEEVEKSGIRAETFNCFFGAHRLTGPEVHLGAIAEYAEMALTRAEQVGGKCAVLGSGGARRIPGGFDPTIAGAQFVRILQILGDAASRHGMTIALEPLRGAETNMINTVETGAAFVSAAQNPGTGLLVDFFHLFSEQESLSHVIEAGSLLRHAHIARPNPDRLVPGLADLEDCRPWAEALRQAGYRERISLEGGMPEFERSIAEARQVLEIFA